MIPSFTARAEDSLSGAQQAAVRHSGNDSYTDAFVSAEITSSATYLSANVTNAQLLLVPGLTRAVDCTTVPKSLNSELIFLLALMFCGCALIRRRINKNECGDRARACVCVRACVVQKSHQHGVSCASDHIGRNVPNPNCS